ncbi:MAG TPA: HD family hydrolase [Kiloniellales bacterium]|nr:HD family hydrolase [Kiloniellales bacterium]
MARRPAAQPKLVEPPRAWQRMLSGRRLDLLNPSPLDIEIEDIAQGLSRVARWNGQTSGDWAFTVAQHSLVVDALIGQLKPLWPAPWRLATLLHDGAEYVLGDLITPFKSQIGRAYKDLENRLLGAIHLRFGLPATLPQPVTDAIKRADKIAAYFEATRLAGFEEAEARRFFGRPGRIAAPNLTPLAPAEAMARFLARFRALQQALA